MHCLLSTTFLTQPHFSSCPDLWRLPPCAFAFMACSTTCHITDRCSSGLLDTMRPTTSPFADNCLVPPPGAVDHPTRYPERQPKRLSRATWYFYGGTVAALVVAVALFIVSFYVDRIDAKVSANAYITIKLHLALVADPPQDQGCDIKTLIRDPNPPAPYWVDTIYDQYNTMIESAGPFTVTSCEGNADRTTVTVTSQQSSKLVKDLEIFNTPYTNGWRGNFAGKYRSSMVSYGLVGGHRIAGHELFAHGVSPFGIYMAVGFFCTALILLVAAMITLGCYRSEHNNWDFRDECSPDPRCCCACCCTTCRIPKNHVRRLVGGIIAFLVLGVAATISHLISCNVTFDLKMYADESFTVPGGYYAVCAVMLVLQLVGLAMMCIVYAKQMW